MMGVRKRAFRGVFIEENAHRSRSPCLHLQGKWYIGSWTDHPPSNHRGRRGCLRHGWVKLPIELFQRQCGLAAGSCKEPCCPQVKLYPRSQASPGSEWRLNCVARQVEQAMVSAGAGRGAPSREEIFCAAQQALPRRARSACIRFSSRSAAKVSPRILAAPACEGAAIL